jgi:hypothetical protein
MEAGTGQNFPNATSTDTAFGSTIIGPPAWTGPFRLDILEPGDFLVDVRLGFVAAAGTLLIVVDHRNSAGTRKRVVDYNKRITAVADGDVFMQAGGMLSAVPGDILAVSVTQTQTSGTAVRGSFYAAGAFANSMTWRMLP